MSRTSPAPPSRQPHVGAQASTLGTSYTRGLPPKCVPGMSRARARAMCMHGAYSWAWARGSGGGVPAGRHRLDHASIRSSTRRFLVVEPAAHALQRVSKRALSDLDRGRGVAERLSAPAAAEGHRVLERLLPASSSGLAAVESISSASISSASSRVMDRPASAASARRLGCAVAGSPRDHPQILILVYPSKAEGPKVVWPRVSQSGSPVSGALTDE